MSRSVLASTAVSGERSSCDMAAKKNDCRASDACSMLLISSALRTDLRTVAAKSSASSLSMSKVAAAPLPQRGNGSC